MSGSKIISTTAEAIRLLTKTASIPHLKYSTKIKFRKTFVRIFIILKVANFFAFLSILNFIKGIALNASTKRMSEV